MSLESPTRNTAARWSPRACYADLSSRAFEGAGSLLANTRRTARCRLGTGQRIGGVPSMLTKGQVNPPHTHLGAADFYVISGGFDYRGGAAREGD